jgi:ribonuclease HII
MAEQHETFPAYGFDHNVGYATPEHKRALDEHGPCAIHRRLFAPVRAACAAHGIPVTVSLFALEPANDAALDAAPDAPPHEALEPALA